MIITVNSCHYLATLGGRLSLQTKDTKWRKLPYFFCSSWLGLVRHCHVMHTMKHQLQIIRVATNLQVYSFIQGRKSRNHSRIHVYIVSKKGSTCK